MNIAELQKAIFGRLDAELSIPVYHDAPQADESESDTDFPYITLEYIISPNDTKTEVGGEAVVQVHVWSRTHDNLARCALYDQIYLVLHRHSLTMVGTDYADVSFDSQSEIPDPDGKTHHGIGRYRVTYFNT